MALNRVKFVCVFPLRFPLYAYHAPPLALSPRPHHAGLAQCYPGCRRSMTFFLEGDLDDISVCSKRNTLSNMSLLEDLQDHLEYSHLNEVIRNND